MPRYSTPSRISRLKYSILAGTVLNASIGDTFPISLNKQHRDVFDGDGNVADGAAGARFSHAPAELPSKLAYSMQ